MVGIGWILAILLGALGLGLCIVKVGNTGTDGGNLFVGKRLAVLTRHAELGLGLSQRALCAFKRELELARRKPDQFLSAGDVIAEPDRNALDHTGGFGADLCLVFRHQRADKIDAPLHRDVLNGSRGNGYCGGTACITTRLASGAGTTRNDTQGQ